MLALSAPCFRTHVIKTKGCYRYHKRIYRLLPRNEYSTAGPKVALAEPAKLADENLEPATFDASPNRDPQYALAETNNGPLLFLARSGKVVDLASFHGGTGGQGSSVLHLCHEGRIVDLEPTSVPPAEAEVGRTSTLPVGSQWHVRRVRPAALPQYYMALSKIRLTTLVAITMVAGYAMAPGALDPTVFLYATLGTALTSCAANALNQYLEVPYDSQMNRTKNRVLVRGILSPLHAFGFATVTGVTGVAMLYGGVNGPTAALGAANLCLYTGCYTPLKRCSILNTWVGSVVGAIPPMMGWAACTGHLDPGAWVLGAILYSWQFPHFNALSWNLRPDYSRAGYRMMSVTHPTLCRVTALRHAVVLSLLCSVAAPLSGLTTWSFAAGSAPLNAYLVYRAWQFRTEADSASSRALFRLSLVYLPALILLMFATKDRSKKDIQKQKT